VVNLASREVASKKQFIEAVAARLGRTLTQARAGTVAEAPGAARAESLGLDVAKAEGLLGRPLPDLRQVVEDLVPDRAAGGR
jgi:dTDP-4-dehydrorhamnose reductase